MKEDNVILARAGAAEFSIALADNESARALARLIGDGELTIPASCYGGFEKVCRLPRALPRDDAYTETGPGDVMLYAGSQLVIFYGRNAWEYTRLGKVADKTARELGEILSGPDDAITLRAAKRG